MLRSKLVLDEVKDLFTSDDFISEARNLEGEVYREYGNRVTKKIQHKDKGYFLKFHGPINWKEVLKNLVLFRLPVVGAKREYLALSKMEQEGINGPKVKYYYSKGISPTNSSSFLVTKELKDTISLEDFFLQAQQKKLSFSQKNNLLTSIANITKKLHKTGINHRDLYLCHYHLDSHRDFGETSLSLIDLHRAQIRRKVPERWLVKDIGGLYHSAIQFGITERDCYRFLMVYFDCSLRELFSNHEKFIKKTRNRAFSMYMKPVLSEIDISSKKALPDQSLYIKSVTKDYRCIGLRGRVSKDILEIIQDEDALITRGQVIKNEKGHLVVRIKISGKELFVKKYRIKSVFHLLRRLFKKTRARNAWEALHWFNSVGIKTMQPILIYEELGILGTVDSILVSEEINGERLDKNLEKNYDAIKIASVIYNFFKRMLWIGFNHGDAKSSNFYINRDKLVVFDLDSSKRHSLTPSLKRNIKRDKRRIYRSLEGSVNLTSALNLRLKEK